MGNTGAEAVATAAGGAAEDGTGAAPATTHGPAAEALLEEAEYDLETEGAVKASEAAAAARVRPPRPNNWGAMTKDAADASEAAAAAVVWVRPPRPSN